MFPNRSQFLALFRGVRYHLQDFAGEGWDPKKVKELFNLCHSSLRYVIERIFGIFKSRFIIFKSTPPFSYKTQAEIVLACARLHNFLHKECRFDEFSIESSDDTLSSSSQLANQWDNYEPTLQSLKQQLEVANEWQNSIAFDMWNDVEYDGN